MAVVGVGYVNKERDQRALESNSCEPVEVVADRNSSYREWATEAVKSSNDLAKIAGFYDVLAMIKDKNKDENDEVRDVVLGQTYRTFICKKT